MLNFWPHNLHLQLNWWSYKYVDAKGSFATKQTIVITLSISLYDEQWVCMKDLKVFAVDVVGVQVFFVKLDQEIQYTFFTGKKSNN